MITIQTTLTFRDWLSGLRDQRAKARIANRIARLASGNPGDVKPVGEGLSELRIDEGAGYRVYFLRRGDVMIVVLCGGDKSTQSADIDRAKKIAKEWR